MLPIVLNPNVLRVGVAGKGDALQRRLRLLDGAGFAQPALFEERLPSAEDIAALHVLFVAGLGRDESRLVADIARKAGVLLNVEDVPELCDFHVPAIARRGDLLLTVSTGGRSPGLSHILREELEHHFGPEWEARLDEIAAARAGWRSSGLAPAEVAASTTAFFNAKGWSAKGGAPEGGAR